MGREDYSDWDATFVAPLSATVPAEMGGLRLDSKEAAFKPGESGEKAILPGRASESRLIKLVSSQDDNERMPSKGQPLSTTEIDLLKRCGR